MTASHAPRLPPQRSDDVLLAAFVEGRDPQLGAALVDRYLPLARSIARRYARGPEPLDDLVQVASIGLLKALERFDLARGVAFSTFAVPTIAGELRRYFRDRSWAVRPPRDLQERAIAVAKTADALTSRLGRSPTVGQIGQELELPDDDILEAMQAMRAATATSLGSLRGSDEDGNDTLESTLGFEEHGFQLAEHRVTYEHLAGSLTDRERRVLHLRFEEDLTQQEIGRRVGVSQMQVSRVLRQALAKLQAQARSPESDGEMAVSP